MRSQEEKNKYQREYRAKTKNSCTNKYEKTKKGFLVRKYRNMQSRVTGVQKLKAHLYQNLSILDRQLFYKWSLSNKEFKKLFQKWEKSNYERRLCPSVNRINSGKGYELDNMEWITHSENSRLGSISQSRR